MDTAITPVSETDSFIFKCSSRTPCFNDCCRDLNQYLTPYDILRMKTQLGLTSEVFLRQYTRSYTGQESGLPVITLRTTPDSGFECPFVRPEGCLVYENRPASCRLYPLARALTRSRETGMFSEQYFLMKEAHCKGFVSGSRWTVREWLKDQNIAPYNEMNDQMMDIIHLKNTLRPGPLDLKSSQMFHLAFYDLDTFKIHVFEKGILNNQNVAPDVLDRARADDVELLKLGMSWIKKVLFGEGAN